MRVRSPKVFAGILMFGLLLCASSTAYADTFAITSFSFNNFQFTPSAGTGQLTLSTALARADVGFFPGPVISNSSTSFPIAQASAVLSGFSASAIADATTNSVGATSSAFLGACSCQGGASGFAMLTGTLVLSGVDGPVDVNITALRELMWQVHTDVFGKYSESSLLMDVLVNGSIVFSLQVEALHPLLLPNQSSAQSLVVQQISRNITLQGNSTNSIGVRISAGSLVINEVPEPASIVLLVSGLGALTGVLRKRRKTSDE
jgi:PEP-CTERM motif